MPPRPQLPGVCPECGTPFPGRIPLRQHRYADHGIHWDSRRAIRGTPRVRKEWSGAETRLLCIRGLSLDVLAKRLGRSVEAVRTKRKRVLAEVERRAASVVVPVKVRKRSLFM